MIATLQLMVGYLILVRAVHRHQPTPLAQFDRYKNRANIALDGRAYVGCLHLTSPLVRVWKPKPSGCTPIATWNLRGFVARFPAGVTGKIRRRNRETDRGEQGKYVAP